MDQAKKARRLDKRLRKKWRRRILTRDVWCQACGEDGWGNKWVFDVAHITPKAAFRDVYGLVEGTRRSYREDNLVLLCKACHSADWTLTHSDRDNPRLIFDWGSERVAEIREKLAQLDPFEDREALQRLEAQEARQREITARRMLEGKDRYEKVTRLFDRIKRDRGWQDAEELPSE